jgi:hypothetical protein
MNCGLVAASPSDSPHALIALAILNLGSHPPHSQTGNDPRISQESPNYSVVGEGGVERKSPISKTAPYPSKNYAPMLKSGFPKPIPLH